MTSTTERLQTLFKGFIMNGIQSFIGFRPSVSLLFCITHATICLIWNSASAAEINDEQMLAELRKSILRQIDDTDSSDEDHTFYISSDSSDSTLAMEAIDWPEDMDIDSWSVDSSSIASSSQDSYPDFSFDQDTYKPSKLKHPPLPLSGLNYDWQSIATEAVQGLKPQGYLKDSDNRFQLGLENFGNTCFFNAAIKLLAADDHFSKQLHGKAGLTLHASKETGSIDNGLRSQQIRKANLLRNHVQTLISLIRQSRGIADRNRHYKQISKLIKKVFRDYRDIYYLSNNRYPESLPGTQQDPEEFLQNLFNFIGYKDKGGFTLADTIKWDYEDSVRISGKTQNTILSLSIKPFGSPTMTSVQEAIDHFLQVEKISGSASNNYQGGEKQFKLLGAPEILLIQLKRYELDYMTMATKRVSNPIKVESIKVPFYDDQGEGQGVAIYQPVAVEVHASLGGKSLNFGHYYTYVKEGDQWIEHNDSTPPHLSHSADEDIRRNAYLIKYRLQAILAAEEETFE